MSTFLERNHLFLRNPHGGVENAAAMKAAGFGAIFCNIKDFALEEWAIVRRNAAQADVVCGPWSRMCSGDGGSPYDRLYLDNLIACAEAWKSPYIVNAESEINGKQEHLDEIIRECGDDDWAISVEPTPFANLDWTAVKVPVLPQCFGPAYANIGGVRLNWQRNAGVDCVVGTFGTYSGWKPELYSLDGPYGLYTADDCGGDYRRWAQTGIGIPCRKLDRPVPPTNGGTLPEEIGTQHGITAFIDWLQKQPGMPARGPGYDPAKPGTWPWPERLERTLNILVKDHDSA